MDSYKFKPKIELHVHLDGSMRHTTIWELLKKKKLPLPGDGSLESLKQAIIATESTDLMTFLRGFAVFLPAIVGDLEAIERTAYEFCEDKAKDGVIYCEARYCPHLLLTHIFNHSPANYLESSTTPAINNNENANNTNLDVSLHCVVKAVNRGLERGRADFGILVRTVLSCIRGKPEWSREILQLCRDFPVQVVGIDIAGDEAGERAIEGTEREELMLDPEGVEVFNEAARLGIHRTVHAGEAGPAAMVQAALERMKAERIGHGYRVLEDASLYARCIREQVHFECCPYSSLLTGAVPYGTVHPIVRFAQDGANFSINTDDPTVTNTKLTDEYKLAESWKLTEEQLVQSNFNAAEAAFCSQEEKLVLLQKLNSAYGRK